MLGEVATSGIPAESIAKLWGSTALLVTSVVNRLITTPVKGSASSWYYNRDMTIEFANYADGLMAPVTACAGPADPLYPGTSVRVYTHENHIVLAAGHDDRVTAFAFPTVSAPDPYVLTISLPSLIADGLEITPWIVTDARFVKHAGGCRNLQITIEFFPIALAAYPGAYLASPADNLHESVGRFRRSYKHFVEKFSGGTAEYPVPYRSGRWYIRQRAATAFGYTSGANITLLIVAAGCMCKHPSQCDCAA